MIVTAPEGQLVNTDLSPVLRKPSGKDTRSFPVPV